MDAMLPSQAMSATALLPLLTAKLRGEFAPLLQTLMQHGTYLSHTYALELIFTLVRFDAALQPAERAVFVHVFNVIVKHLVDEVRQCGRLRRQLHELQAMLRGMLSRCAALQELYDVVSSAAAPQTQQQQTVVTPSATHVDIMLAVSDDRYGVTHGAGGMASGALGGSSLANNNSMDIPVSLRNSPLQSTLVCELASSVPLSQNSSMANVPAAQLQRCNSVQRLVHGNFRRRVNRSLLGMPTESQSSLAIAPTQPDLTLATSVESVSERVEEAQRPQSPMKDALMQSWEQVFWALLSGELPRADGQLLLFLLSQPESRATALPTTSGSPGAVKTSSVPGATTTTTATGTHDTLGPSRVVNHSMTSNSTSGGMVGAQMTSSAATRAEQERRRTSPSTQRQRQRVVTEALKAMELQPDMLQSELWGGLHSALLVLVDCFLIGAEDQRPGVASPKAAEKEQTQPGAFTAGRNGTETRYGGRPSTGRSVRQAPPRPLTPGDRAVTSMFMINDQPRTLPRSASFPYMPPSYNNAAEETDVTDGENGLSGAVTNDEMNRPVPLEEVPLASADALALLRLLCPALHNYSGAIETLLTTAAPSLASRATSGRGLTTSAVTGESIVEDEEDEASALLRQATVQPLRAVDVLLHVFLAALAWQYMSSTTASHMPATVRPRVAETVPSVASFSSFQPTPVPPATALPWQTAMAVGGGGGGSANGSFAMDPSSIAGPRRGQAVMGDDPSPLVPTSFNYSFASAATTMTAAPQTASPTALLQGRLRGLLEHTRRAVTQRTTGATQTGEESSGHDTAAPRQRSVLDVMGDVLRSMLSEVEDGLVAVAKMEAQARGEATLVIFRVVSTVLDWLIPTVHVVDRRMCIFYRRWICELYRLLYDNDLLERFTCILNQNVHDTGDDPAEEGDSGATTTVTTTEAANQASESTRRRPSTSEPTRRTPHGKAGGQALTASASETETGSATSTGTRSPTQRTATTTTGSSSGGSHVRLSAPKTSVKEHDNKAGSAATTTQAHHKMTSHARPHRDTPPMSHQTTTKPRTARLEVQKAQKESRGDSSVERSSKTSLSRHGSSSNDGGRMKCSTGGVEEESATVSLAKAATQENTKSSTTTNDSVAMRQPGGLPTSSDTLYDLLVPGCGLQRVGSASSIAAVQLYNRQRAAMGSAVHAARLLLNHGTIVPPPRHYILSRLIAATVRGLDKEAVRSILAIFAVPEENGTNSLTRPPTTLPTNDIALSSSSTSSSASSSSTSSSSSSPVRRNDNNSTDQHGLSTAASSSSGRTQHKTSGKAASHAHRQNVKARTAGAIRQTSNTPSEPFTTMTTSSSRTRPLHQSPSPAVAAASTLGPNMSRRAAQRAARNASGTSSAASPIAITTTTTTGGNTVMSSNTNNNNNNAVVVAGEGTPALLHHHRFRYPAVTQQADLAALYHHTLQDAELLLSPHDPIRAGLVRAVVDYYANDMHDVEGALQILDNYLSDVNEERVQLPYTRPVVLGLSGDEAAYAAAPSAALGENSNSELGHGARHAANALQGHAAITTAPSSPLGSWNGHISASDAATLSSAQASEVFYSASHELRQSAASQSGTMTANGAALNSGGEEMDGAPVVPLVIPSWTTAEEQAEFTCILRDLRTMQLALQSSS